MLIKPKPARSMVHSSGSGMGAADIHDNLRGTLVRAGALQIDVEISKRRIQLPCCEIMVHLDQAYDTGKHRISIGYGAACRRNAI